MKKLIKIQKKLYAPKNLENTFGKYRYRSCESILEAVKPLLEEEGCTLTLSDDVELVGDRYYIRATATISDGEQEKSVTAYARESMEKKGMDASQVTGSASSYARKYALNGLFLIDDSKLEPVADPDSDEYREIQGPPKQKQTKQTAPKGEPIDPAERERLIALCRENDVSVSDLAARVGVKPGNKMTKPQYAKAIGILNGIIAEREAGEIFA